MFVCEECLDKHFEQNWVGAMVSYGPCEMCGQPKPCDDWPHGVLTTKREEPRI